MKRSVTIGTAGHIDHGKTALVRALTGVDTDRLPQEKKRGITIDLGFAHLDLGETRVGIVDVPGHERFIKNMLAGAAGIEGVMLVVAADDGVMPQTREHLAILNMLRVRTGIVVLTKTDLVKPDWLDLVEAEIGELVKGSVLEGAPIVRTSAATGVGIDELREAMSAMVSAIEHEVRREAFRMPIDRCFVVEGRGTVVTGTVWSGSVSLDDELECLPGGKILKVRGLQSHGQSAERLERGRRAAINLSGAHHSEIERGCELATPGYLKPSRRLTVQLRALSDAPWPIKHRSRVRLHIGTAEVMASVRLLNGNALEPGQTGLAQLVCAQAVATTCRQPLVVRAESPLVTIGGGMVLQAVGPLIRPANSELIARVGMLASSDQNERTETAIYLEGDGQWTELDLCRSADVGLDESAGMIEKLESAGSIIRTDTGRLVHVDRLDELGLRLEKWLEMYHMQQPLQTGAPMVVLGSQLEDISDDVLCVLIEQLVGTGRLKKNGQNIALATFKPALSNSQRQLLGKIGTIYRAAGFKPPEISAAANTLGVNERSLRPVMELAVATGQLVHLGSGLYMDAQAEQTMRDRIIGHLERSGEMAMSDLRDLLETSRKYAVPLGEYLDRAGVTRRKGDVRVLVRAIKAQAT